MQELGKMCFGRSLLKCKEKGQTHWTFNTFTNI